MDLRRWASALPAAAPVITIPASLVGRLARFDGQRHGAGGAGAIEGRALLARLGLIHFFHSFLLFFPYFLTSSASRLRERLLAQYVTVDGDTPIAVARAAREPSISIACSSIAFMLRIVFENLHRQISKIIQKAFSFAV